MKVSDTLEQLAHVELDDTRLELDSRILQEAGKVMIHIREDHINRTLVIAISSYRPLRSDDRKIAG